MRTAAAVSCNLLFILVDVVVTTVLYVHGAHPAVFAKDMQDFDVFTSVFDLWGIMLVRVCLLLGASFGVSWNSVDGPRRVLAVGPLCDLLCLVFIAYAVAKLLLFSEQSSLMYDPWFLSLFSWTCASAIGAVCLWRLLGRSPNVVDAPDGGGDEDSERLVDQAGEEDEEAEGEKEQKGAKEAPRSGATVGRLLSYCREDAGLLAVAVLFLLLSAVCESIPKSFALAANKDDHLPMTLDDFIMECHYMQ